MILLPMNSFPFLALTLRRGVYADTGSACQLDVKSGWREAESPSIGKGWKSHAQVIGHSGAFLSGLVRLTWNHGAATGIEKEARFSCCFCGSSSQFLLSFLTHVCTISPLKGLRSLPGSTSGGSGGNYMGEQFKFCLHHLSTLWPWK